MFATCSVDLQKRENLGIDTGRTDSNAYSMS